MINTISTWGRLFHDAGLCSQEYVHDNVLGTATHRDSLRFGRSVIMPLTYTDSLLHHVYHRSIGYAFNVPGHMLGEREYASYVYNVLISSPSRKIGETERMMMLNRVIDPHWIGVIPCYCILNFVILQQTLFYKQSLVFYSSKLLQPFFKNLQGLKVGSS